MQTQDFSSLTKHLSFPIHRAGWPFIAVAAVVAYILGGIWSLLGWLGFFALIWTIWFFRDPRRVTPTRAGLVVSAADGTVAAVDTAVPPAELGLGDQPLPRVSVLRGLFAVQINRVPADAAVAVAVMTPGSYHLSSKPEAAENARAGYVFKRTDGASVAVVQYAGALARALSCDLSAGQSVVAGERFGILRFTIEPLKPVADRLYRRIFKGEKIAICDGAGCGGQICNLKSFDFKACLKCGGQGAAGLYCGHLSNRIDLYLPAGSVALVAPGQSVVAGETVVADLASTEAARPFETR